MLWAFVVVLMNNCDHSINFFCPAFSQNPRDVLRGGTGGVNVVQDNVDFAFLWWVF